MSQIELIDLRLEVAELEHLSREINAIFAPLLAREIRIYRRIRAGATHQDCIKRITRVFFRRCQRIEKTKTRSLGNIPKRWLENKAALFKLENRLPTSNAIVTRPSRQERINLLAMNQKAAFNNQIALKLEDNRAKRAEMKRGFVVEGKVNYGR